MMRSTLSLIVAMGMMFVAGSPASAQSQPSGEPSGYNWEGVRAKGLTTVFVRDTDGVSTTGKLLAFSPDALVLLVNGEERRLERSSVLRVQTRDSLKNGTIIGAVAGVILGSITAGIADCTSGAGSNGCPGVRLAFLALSTATYAGLGAGIDALVPGRTTIYAAPQHSRTGRIGARSTGIGLARATISW